MRITFLSAPPNLSGGVKVLAIYAQKLAARGHEVVVVAQRPRVPTRLEALRGLLRTGRLRLTPPMRSHFDDRGIDLRLAAVPGPIRATDVPDADVVVASWWETAYMAAALPPQKGAKTHFIQHHEVHDHLPAHITRGVHYLPLKRITISEWLVETMARDYGDHDVTLIENGVDTAHFQAPERGRQETPTVGLLYAPGRMKGVDLSLKAIERARRRFPDLKIVAFGAVDPTPALPLPPGSDFTRQPPQDEVPRIYARCDVWLCGSRAEGFHLPPLEAMACRTPVVATRVGGTVETVVDGENGYLVENGDWEALGDRLADALAQTPEAWQAMSAAARARAETFTWDRATERLEAALAAAVAKGSSKD